MPPRRAPATPGNSITCTMVGSLSQQARSDIFDGVGSLSAFFSLSLSLSLFCLLWFFLSRDFWLSPCHLEGFFNFSPFFSLTFFIVTIIHLYFHIPVRKALSAVEKLGWIGVSDERCSEPRVSCCFIVGHEGDRTLLLMIRARVTSAYLVPRMQGEFTNRKREERIAEGTRGRGREGGEVRYLLFMKKKSVFM